MNLDREDSADLLSEHPGNRSRRGWPVALKRTGWVPGCPECRCRMTCRSGGHQRVARNVVYASRRRRGFGT